MSLSVHFGYTTQMWFVPNACNNVFIWTLLTHSLFMHQTVSMSLDSGAQVAKTILGQKTLVFLVHKWKAMTHSGCNDCKSKRNGIDFQSWQTAALISALFLLHYKLPAAADTLRLRGGKPTVFEFPTIH